MDIQQDYDLAEDQKIRTLSKKGTVLLSHVCIVGKLPTLSNWMANLISGTLFTARRFKMRFLICPQKSGTF